MPAKAIKYRHIMSDKKIQLPDFLIADLYKSSLVDIETLNSNRVITEAEDNTKIFASTGITPKISFLGENSKQVVILVNDTEAEFLAENNLTFLTNILKACNLTLADIAIINTSTQDITFKKIKEELNPTYLLLFDVEPSAIKLPFLVPAFQLQRFNDCSIMFAPQLSDLNKQTQDGKLLKTKLWLSLKKIFNLE